MTEIIYKSKSFKLKGIEILRIKDFFESRLRIEKPHILNFYLFIFFTEGEGEHFIDFSWKKVKRGTLVYLAQGQVNAFKFNKNLKGYIIIYTKDYLNEQLVKMPKEAFVCLFTPHLYPSTFQIPESTKTINYVDSLYQEHTNNQESFSQKHIIDSLYIIIFSKIEQLKGYNILYSSKSNKLSYFLKFEELLQKEYQISRNANYYAKKLNITYQYLNLICKEIINQSTKQFIDSFIILNAKRKLINFEIKSTKLAYEMGFEESTNFVKYFKKHTTYTPNQFKNIYF